MVSVPVWGWFQSSSVGILSHPPFSDKGLVVKAMIFSSSQYSPDFSDSHSVVSFCDPMDYTVHGILQARILECVAFPFSMGSSWPRDRAQVSRSAGGCFTSWATAELLPSSRVFPVMQPSVGSWVCHMSGLFPIQAYRIDTMTLEADFFPKGKFKG